MWKKETKFLKSLEPCLYESGWVEMFGNLSCANILFIVTNAFV